MKKLSVKRFRQRNIENTSSQITNETVAEHREKILAGGRKFKYPIQYAKHKLVINAVLVVLVSAVILLVIGWWQIYPMQNSSTFIYRLARLFPVPAAVVDGEQVRMSDYLVQYRGNEYYLSKYDEIKITSADGKRQLNYVKRESMDKAIAASYARKIARAKGITVSDKEVDDIISNQRNMANGRVSQDTYDASIMMMYDWSPSDYRLTVKNMTLRNKVAFAVDANAKAQADAAAKLVASTNGDFAKVAEGIASLPGAKPLAGQTGFINTVNAFGGLSVAEVAKLNKDQVSGPLMSTTDDGYYFVKLIDKNDTQVNFSYLHIPLKQFNDDLAQLRKDGKIHEFINIAKQ